MIYDFLEKQNLPLPLQNKPKWVSCLVITSGFLIITLSAIAIGVILGYTYCYIEHRGSSGKSGTVTQSTIQIVMPYSESADARYNRTINGALFNLFVSKGLKMG